MSILAPQHWEYEHHPRRYSVLRSESYGLYLDLIERRIDAKILVSDTRDAHRRLFSKLTPTHQPNLAGHYRGENFPYLKECRVSVPANPSVGCPPHLVNGELYKFNELAQHSIARIDMLTAAPTPLISEGEKFMAIIQCTALLGAYFMAIHPYANGNGHIGRLVMVALLGRYGHWPAELKIDPRPLNPSYSTSIQQHQQGNPRPLEEFLMRSIKGTSL